MGDEFSEKFCTWPNKILLKAHFLRYQAQIWNTTSRFMALI